jgi:hypothetical protein
MAGMSSIIRCVFQNVMLLVLLLAGLVSADNGDNNCQVPADPDVQGLGVRLGLYFQLLSTLLLTVVRPEEAAGTFLSTAFFLASFLIAVLYSAIQNEFPPGATISCTWYPVIVQAALVPVDFKEYNSGQKTARAGMVALSYCISLSLNAWFWMKGLDRKSENQCMEPRVFFFYNFGAYGNIRTLFKVFSLGLIGGCVLSLFYGLFYGLFCAEITPSTTDIELGPEQGETPCDIAQTDQSILSSERTRRTITSPTRALTAPPRVRSSEPPKRADTISATLVRASTMPTTLVSRVTTSRSFVLRATTGNSQVDVKIKWIYSFVPEGLFWLLFYIIASELQLRWNHLTDINSVATTGQIIPLVLGSFSLLRTLYLLKDVKLESLKNVKIGTPFDEFNAWLTD